MEKKFIKSYLITTFFLGTLAFSNDDKNLGTLIITAQKTKQNLQDTPLSVSVFNQLSIEDKNIENISDVIQYVPNFSSFQNGGLSGVVNPSVRGISSISPDSAVAVPIIIDGIAITSSIGYNLSLIDIERIEVLRGPQGTLYGSGAEAGVINITTRTPSNERTSKIDVEFGSDNKQQYTFNT